MFDIRLVGKSPIYEQLFSGIARLISTEQLKPDERLPAVREVAKQMGINPNTVQKTYALLEQAGLIYSIPAKGSYVAAGNSVSEALRADALKRMSAALETAAKNGVTRVDAIAAVEKIWSEDRKEGES